MSKYSEFFLLGNPEYVEVGDKLRLRKYGSWLVEEVWCREEQGKKRAQFSLQVIRLARRIAKEKGVGEDEAFEMLQNTDEAGAELFAEFSEEVNSLMAMAPSNKDQFEELATLFFKNRGQVLNGKKWMDTTDWTVEDTKKLPQVFFAAIENFMASEDSNTESIIEKDEQEEEAPSVPKYP